MREQERQAVTCYNTIYNKYLSKLRKQAKVHWLKEGDVNSAYFHRSLKQRRMINRIYEIDDMNSVRVKQQNEIEEAFTCYYKELLGSNTQPRIHVNSSLVKKGRVLNVK